MKFKITYVPDGKTVEAIVKAENEEEAMTNFFNKVGIISEETTVHDDGYIDVKKLESEGE